MLSQRPLLRSPSFWLGIPALLFLLWFWWDSAKMDRALAWNAGRLGTFFAKNSDSSITLTRAPCVSSFGFINDRWSFLREFAYVKEATFELDPSLRFPAPKIGRDEQGRLHAELPYWTMLLLYLAAWASLLAWRHKRYAKAVRDSAAS